MINKNIILLQLITTGFVAVLLAVIVISDGTPTSNNQSDDLKKLLEIQQEKLELLKYQVTLHDMFLGDSGLRIKEPHLSYLKNKKPVFLK